MVGPKNQRYFLLGKVVLTNSQDEGVLEKARRGGGGQKRSKNSFGKEQDKLPRNMKGATVVMTKFSESLISTEAPKHWNLGIWSPGVGLIYGSKTPTANKSVEGDV